jgi:hypothetical protein
MPLKLKMLSISALLIGAQLSLAHGQSTTGSASPDVRPGHVPGVGTSYPLSPNASNITSADTSSPIAPTSPQPAVGPDASVMQLLHAASQSIASGQTGTADNALEDAETNILTRSVVQGTQSTPSSDPVVSQIEQARQALGMHDSSGAAQQINQILSSNAPELAD